MTPNRRELLHGSVAILISGSCWSARGASTLALPGRWQQSTPHWAHQMLAWQLDAWERGDLSHLADAGASNPEWDFMGRTFFVLALANVALREPQMAGRCVAAIDRIAGHTLDVERQRGATAFLLPYGRKGGWCARPGRSLFVDGEIAAMLAARALVAGIGPWAEELDMRLMRVREAMRGGPVLSGESYPDECWTFCNTFGLMALALARVVGMSVDDTLGHDWLAMARRQLLGGPRGLLVSSYRWDGTHLDGPEGSSLWMSLHNLRWVDPVFASRHYARARDALLGTVAGFGYAREWPDGGTFGPDVDSGPIVPLLGASPGSSGLALVAAGAFGDRAAWRALTASLELAALPHVQGGGRRYLAGNAVGDAVILYAAVQGPLYDLWRSRT